jgi:hypothetical protein
MIFQKDFKHVPRPFIVEQATAMVKEEAKRMSIEYSPTDLADNVASLSKMLEANYHIEFASNFFGMHTISANIVGANLASNPTGIQVLETKDFKLQCLETLTQLKFVLVTDPGNTSYDDVLHRIYLLYSDYGMLIQTSNSCNAFVLFRCTF